MLKKINRIQKTKDFQRIFKNTKPVFSNHLSFRVYKNPINTKMAISRFAFVVSNKVDKRSTRRNALKRQLREITRSLIFEFLTGYDVVVFVKNNFSYPYDQEEIKREFLLGIKKAGILKK